MRPLCVGRDPDWWTPASEQARLAMRICSVCVGCPVDDDPAPHGVIRHGIPYSDAGKVVPLCPNCARPNVDYRGGELGLCRACAVPDVPIPSARGDRDTQIVALTGQGLSDAAIGAQFGLKAESVRKIRRRIGCRRKAAPLPVPEQHTNLKERAA